MSMQSNAARKPVDAPASLAVVSKEPKVLAGFTEAFLQGFKAGQSAKDDAEAVKHWPHSVEQWKRQEEYKIGYMAGLLAPAGADPLAYSIEAKRIRAISPAKDRNENEARVYQAAIVQMARVYALAGRTPVKEDGTDATRAKPAPRQKVEKGDVDVTAETPAKEGEAQSARAAFALDWQSPDDVFASLRTIHALLAGARNKATKVLDGEKGLPARDALKAVLNVLNSVTPRE